MRHRAGFTLIEILTAVVIVAILVIMAVPLYEKTIERSRMAEARTVLAKLQDAKLLTMDNMGCTTYNATDSACPKLKHLNIAFASPSKEGTYSFGAKSFDFTLVVPTYSNAVCAKRNGGEYKGTLFLYAAPGVISSTSGAQLLCNGSHCEEYGLGSSSFTCTF